MRNYEEDYPKNWQCEDCENPIKSLWPMKMKGMIEYNHNHCNRLPLNSIKWNLIGRKKFQNGKVRLLSLKEVITLTLRDKKLNRKLNYDIYRHNRKVI